MLVIRKTRKLRQIFIKLDKVQIRSYKMPSSYIRLYIVAHDFLMH